MNSAPVSLAELEAWVASIEAAATGDVDISGGPELDGRPLDESVPLAVLESLEARLASAIGELSRRRDEAGDELSRLAARPR